MGYFTVQITILYVVLTDFLLKIIKLGTNIGELVQSTISTTVGELVVMSITLN